MKKHIPKDLWSTVVEILTPERRQRMEYVASQRTRNLHLVLQDVHDPHNVSACLRSAEAFGVQEVSVVSPNVYRATGVARGSAKWLQIHSYQDVESCVRDLRKRGFKIAVTLPTPEVSDLAACPIAEPLALVLGNEHAGVGQDWLNHADYALTIPMRGFVESFNISVACAICLSSLWDKMSNHWGEGFTLPANEQTELLNLWATEQLPNWEKIYERLS